MTLFSNLLDLFQSTLPAGGATTTSHNREEKKEFQSTLPAGGATVVLVLECVRPKFQSTLPAGGATWFRGHLVFADYISIHAPRGGSDVVGAGIGLATADFNPRSPWGERPILKHNHLLLSNDFNPRSPWGERLVKALIDSQKTDISIHAPRGGSDGFPEKRDCKALYFNPRSPWGERHKTYLSHIHL